LNASGGHAANLTNLIFHVAPLTKPARNGCRTRGAPSEKVKTASEVEMT
jgi:hypothetical protein